MPACNTAGSTYGTPPPGIYNTCPAGTVLIGADLAFTTPQNSCPAGSSKTCSATSVQPGTVQGINGYFCASNGNSNAIGNVETARYPAANTTTSASSTATFLCPDGQALTGATAWTNSAGVEQIQFNCSNFEPGAAPGLQSSLYPTSTSGTTSGTIKHTLSTLAAAPTALFANAIAQGQNAAGNLNALGFGCRDYADELDTSAARQQACCAGTATNPDFCREFTPQSASCDTYMTKYCAGNCTSGSCLDVACGCLGSPVDLPGCYDGRCADTPGAYRTALMEAGQQVCTAATCDIWQKLGEGQHLAKATPAPAGCAAAPSSIFSNTTIIIILSLILLIMIAGRLFDTKEIPLPLIPDQLP